MNWFFWIIGLILIVGAIIYAYLGLKHVEDDPPKENKKKKLSTAVKGVIFLIIFALSTYGLSFFTYLKVEVELQNKSPYSNTK